MAGSHTLVLISQTNLAVHLAHKKHLKFLPSTTSGFYNASNAHQNLGCDCPLEGKAGLYMSYLSMLVEDTFFSKGSNF